MHIHFRGNGGILTCVFCLKSGWVAPFDYAAMRGNVGELAEEPVTVYETS